MSLNNPLITGTINGFKPDPRLTVSEWSDKYRILTTEASAEAGKWRTDRTPYLREIMDEMSPTSPTTQVKVIKGTQLGFSSIADNIAMCYLDFYPCPILYLLPTETLAKGTSKRRITPSIKAIPRLAKKVVGGKSKDDVGEIYSKAVAGGNLTFGWSQSTASFRSFSARVVMLDDVDGFGVFGEGNVLKLGKARADAFSNKKIYINSTPTNKGASNIEQEYKESDQREYNMPCPECNELMVFDWEYMKYELTDDGHIKGDVKCACPKCGSLIPEYKKTQMMLNGVWVATNPSHPHKGYRLSSFYSPVGWLSWNEIAGEFVEAHNAMLRGDSELMRVWVNTRNAKVWEQKLDGVTIKSANDRVEHYAAEVPNDVMVITCGVDTQDDRFECEVLGHCKNGETYSIDYKVIAGDPKFEETQQQLDEYLTRVYTREDGNTMTIYGTAIDTGGHRTEDIYEYCKKRTNMKVFAIKGSSTRTSPITNKTMSDIVPNQLTLFSLNVNVLKDSFYANLSITESGAGYCHFPNKPVYNDKYFRMLTAEKRDEKNVYVKVRLRNEALDVRVYALAVIHITQLRVNNLRQPIIYTGVHTQQSQTKQTTNPVNFVSQSNYLDEF